MARLAGVLLLLLLVGCTGGSSESKGEAAADPLLQRVESSWLGRYGQRDEAISKMLTAQQGWLSYRDMDLFEAIRLFSEVGDDASRIGLTRAYLEMARTFNRLDHIFLDIEISYLVSSAEEASEEQRARLGMARLRRGDLAQAEEIFSAPSPKGLEGVWQLGRAGVQFARGQTAQGTKMLDGVCGKAGEEYAELVRVVTTLWGEPQACEGGGYYAQALNAMEAGDLFSGVVALQMLDHASANDDAGPDLFLYAMLRRIFSRLALASLGEVDPASATFLQGQAFLYLGESEKALEKFEAAATVAQTPQVAVYVFGPLLDGEELAALARVQQGRVLAIAGRDAEAKQAWSQVDANGTNALALVALAAAQRSVNSSAPLSSPPEAVIAAKGQTLSLRQSSADLKGGSDIAALMAARVAEVARYSARVARDEGNHRDALDLVDGAHRKRKGYRPDFVNPPSFMVELAQAYAGTGQYAPAVEILFELSHEFPSARLGYESLKRLYASRSGGEAPPR